MQGSERARNSGRRAACGRRGGPDMIRIAISQAAFDRKITLPDRTPDGRNRPFAAFKIGPVNVRERRGSGLSLKIMSLSVV